MDIVLNSGSVALSALALWPVQIYPDFQITKFTKSTKFKNHNQNNAASTIPLNCVNVRILHADQEAVLIFM